MISVIIPVYNGEQFIDRCYECLISQSYDNWEAIFINDGSLDRSLEKLKDLQHDSRVKLIDKKNEGVALAREIGIKEAKGEVITFLDVDDYLESVALERFSEGFNDEIDIVIGGMNLVSSDGRVLNRIGYHDRSIMRNTAVSELCDGKIRWQLCGKAFRSNLFEDVITPVGIRGAEDMAVCIQVALKSRRIRIYNDYLYNYTQLYSSVTHANAKHILSDNLLAANFITNLVGPVLGVTNIECIYLLIISSSLRMGLEGRNEVYRAAIHRYYKFRALRKLPLKKTISLSLYRFFDVNLAKYLR